MNIGDLDQETEDVARHVPEFARRLYIGFHDQGFSREEAFALLSIYLASHTVTVIRHESEWTR